MNVIRERIGTGHVTGRRRSRIGRAAVTALFAIVVLLLLAAEAQAYVPGQLIWAKRIGSSAGKAAAWAVARGPNDAGRDRRLAERSADGPGPDGGALYGRRQSLGQDVREPRPRRGRGRRPQRQRLRRRDP